MTTCTRAVGVSVGLLVAACAAPPAPPASGRLVILISLDTLRADHLGAYGYPRPISPNIDALARRGVVFEDASSTAPWTLPAHASMLTGLYPSRHGATFDDRRVSSTVSTLAEVLRREGVLTAAAVNFITLSPQNGLDRGFERFLYLPADPEACDPTTALTDQVLAWAEAWRGRDAFLFLHDFDIHVEYCALPAYEAAVTRPYDGIIQGTGSSFKLMSFGALPFDDRDIRHLIDLYDAGILQTDDEMGRLVLNLEARGLSASTTIVLVSDHGEGFYEHGQFRHSMTQYQELLHVPLIVAGAGVPAGQRITAPVSLVDVAPTIAGLFGVAMPTGNDGIDLAPGWHGETPDSARTLFAQANGAGTALEPWTRRRAVGRPGDDLWMARKGPDKLVVDLFEERLELYDLARDAGERQERSAAAPAVVHELRTALDRLAASPRPATTPVSLSEETRELLDALGYVR